MFVHWNYNTCYMETDKQRGFLPSSVELSPEEGRALFDTITRERLGVSGDEFIERFNAGEFHGDTPDEVQAVILMPFGVLQEEVV